MRDLIGNHHSAAKRLLIVDEVTDNLRTVLLEHRVSSVTSDQVALFLEYGTVINDDLTPDQESPARHAPDVPSRGLSAFQVLCRLIEAPPGTPQTAIARDAHVSQPRVSQVRKTLHELGFADGADQDDRTELLDQWLAHYPGPGGVSTRWYRRDPVDQVASAAYEHAVAADTTPPLSGESAADLVAPYAHHRVIGGQMVDLLLHHTGTHGQVIDRATADADVGVVRLAYDDPRLREEVGSRSGSMSQGDAIVALIGPDAERTHGNLDHLDACPRPAATLGAGRTPTGAVGHTPRDRRDAGGTCVGTHP